MSRLSGDVNAFVQPFQTMIPTLVSNVVKWVLNTNLRSRHPIAASVPPQPCGAGCRAFGIELGEEAKGSVERVVSKHILQERVVSKHILQERAVFGTSGRVQPPFLPSYS
jgi:hypothetical protein